MLELLAAATGVRFDGFRICLHHPDGDRATSCAAHATAASRLRGCCSDAAAELAIDLAASWMVGDTDDDVTAGHAAGCATVLVEHPGSAHKRVGRPLRDDHVTPDLAHAADFIIWARRGRLRLMIDDLNVKIFADGANLEACCALADARESVASRPIRR